MCVEFYELKFIDLIWAYNLKVLMGKTLSRVLGGGPGLDEWVVPEPWVGGSHRRGSGVQGGALPGPEQHLGEVAGRAGGHPRASSLLGEGGSPHGYPHAPQAKPDTRVHVCALCTFMPRLPRAAHTPPEARSHRAVPTCTHTPPPTPKPLL